jgi:DNA repair protein RadC
MQTKTYKKVYLACEKVHNYEEEPISFTNPSDVADYVRRQIGDRIGVNEFFYAMFFDAKRHIISYSLISIGGTTATVVEPKIVCKMALDCLAESVIVSHNHPSGNLSVSASDVNLTSKLKKGLSYFNIDLSDHIIVTEDGYYSMNAEGEL